MFIGCGGFKICPQIWHFPLQKAEPHPSAPPHVCGVDSVTCFKWVEYSEDDGVSLWLLPCSASHTAWSGESQPSAMSWGHPSSLWRGPPGEKLRPEASKKNWDQQLAGKRGLLTTAMWVRHLGSRFPSPSQAFRWWQPSQHLDCNFTKRPWVSTTELNHSQIPEPQKLWNNF